MQSVRGCVLAVPLHSRNPCAIYALYESIAFKVYYKFTFVVCRTKKNQLGVQTQFTGAGRKARPFLALPASPAGKKKKKAGTIFRPPAYSSLYD